MENRTRGGQLCVLYVCDIFALTLPSACAVRSDLPRKCLVALLLATHTHLLSWLQASAQKKKVKIVSRTQMHCATWYMDSNKHVYTYTGEAWIYYLRKCVCRNTLRHNIQQYRSAPLYFVVKLL